MGFIALHSARHSKPFKKILVTICNSTWREDPDRELMWVINPHHPISHDLGWFIKLDEEEAYGEPFAVLEPDELVFIESFKVSEVFVRAVTNAPVLTDEIIYNQAILDGIERSSECGHEVAIEIPEI